MPLRRRSLVLQGLTILALTAGRQAESRLRDKRQHSHTEPPLVMIDPGHGGKDPGCIGVTGVEEKQVVLALGLELRRQLQARRHCRVAMTRETDMFVPLEDRISFARNRRARLLVSLHANSAPDPKAHGACVYRFAYTASDKHARALAEWENSADRLGGPAFQGVSPSLAHILASLMRRETWLHSAQLQHAMVDALDDYTRMSPVPSRHARFVVLSAPDIASVLIEAGFLTNPLEEKLLRSAAHRNALAHGMRSAVEQQLAHPDTGALHNG